MRFDDRLFQEKWSKTPFRAAIPAFSDAVERHAAAEVPNRARLLRFLRVLLGRAPATSAAFAEKFGTDREPESSVWLASLSEGMAGRFREELKVLDYGCGVGRLCNFMSARLKSFAYVGLEKGGGVSGHGEQCVRIASAVFGMDSRARFGLIGSTLHSEAVQQSDVAVLGSVFTHLGADGVEAILTNLQPIMDRGGAVVCSIFTADQPRLQGKGAYGFTDCYDVAQFSQPQLDALWRKHGVKADERETFLAQEVNLHRILLLTKR